MTAENTLKENPERNDWVWSFEDHKIATRPTYHTVGYQKMFAEYDLSDSRLVVGIAGSARVEIPILVREISPQRLEAYSAYGYGGYLGDGMFRLHDVDKLRSFLAGHGIVALFLRHSPFLDNHHFWPEYLLEKNRWTYSVNLHNFENLEQGLKALPKKLRWSVNYARRAGLDVDFYTLDVCSAEHITRFYQLYADVMAEKEADSYYWFSEEFFLAHARYLGASCELAQIQDPQTGELLAGAFFIRDEAGWVHYHLSAAKKTAMKLQAMEWLIFAAIFRYGQERQTNLHLGGGHLLDESDGLSRFKAQFSDHRHSFFTTKLICDQLAYDEERKKIPLLFPQFFLVADARGV